MALTPEEWNALQERAVNPFRSNESNAVNRLTRALTLGDDVLLEEDKAEHIDYKHVKVLANHYIKDDVYIHFDTDVALDFTDDDNYLSLTDRGMDRAGTYYVAMHYVYAESIPFPIATFKILKNPAELTAAVVLVCNAHVEWNAGNNRFEIISIDYQNVPILMVNILRSGDTINIPFERLSGLSIEQTNPKTDSVAFSGGKIIDKDEQKVRFLSASTLGPFSPVSASGKKRYDLVSIKFDGTVHITTGVEVDNAVTVEDALMQLPFDEFPLAFVMVNEPSTVIISTTDIVDVRDFINTPQDLRDEIVALLDFCSSLSNKYDALAMRVNHLEAVVGI